VVAGDVALDSLKSSTSNLAIVPRPRAVHGLIESRGIPLAGSL
jgi:hypothetical protein